MTACDLIAFILLLLLVALFKIHDWFTIAALRESTIKQNATLFAENRELVRLIALSKGVPSIAKYLDREQVAAAPPTEKLEDPDLGMPPYES